MSSSAGARLTGREPRLSIHHSQSGERRLSLRGLRTMLHLLPPESIALDVIAAALRSDDFFARYDAARLLGRRGDRDARLVLADALASAGAPARASAARQLHFFSWHSVESLIRQALKDADPRVREGAVYALCDMRDLNAYRVLTDALQNEADNVRAAAAWGLRSRKDPAAVPPLEAALRASDPDVRVKALEALGATEAREATPAVRAALGDLDLDVKYAATLSWIELSGEGCLIELAETIKRADGAARAPIVRGFFHATNYLAIDVARSPAAAALIEALEITMSSDAPDARKAAAWPLAWIDHPRASLALKQAYEREPDEDVKAHLVRVAVGLMSDAGEAILQNALASPSDVVREAAEWMRAAARRRRLAEGHAPEGSGPIWRRQGDIR